jgi:Cu+-exporting ATPase
LRQGWLNIDAPIALAILITFGRSVYEILSGTGPGYLDSMSGIVFFMLIGRWFQNRTYDAFSFDRDYRSYFPLGVSLIEDGKEKNISVSSLKKGDLILVRNQEMIPADGILKDGAANIDYSFVSGENTPVDKRKGELIYAGGRQMGTAIQMEVVTPVSQSYITQLWNNDIFHNKKNKEQSFIHPWSTFSRHLLVGERSQQDLARGNCCADRSLSMQPAAVGYIHLRQHAEFIWQEEALPQKLECDRNPG